MHVIPKDIHLPKWQIVSRYKIFNPRNKVIRYQSAHHITMAIKGAMSKIEEESFCNTPESSNDL